MKPKAITLDFWGTLFTEGQAFLEKSYARPVRNPSGRPF